MEKEFDLIIIGGGPGGYSAAFKAAECGMKTALIEKERVGGTCLHRGCIPTKTLLHYAELMAFYQPPIFKASELQLDWAALKQRKEEVIAQLEQGLLQRLKKNKVEVIYGSARIVASKEVEVASQRLHASQILIASGSAPAVPPIQGLQEIDFYTSNELLENPRPLGRLAILGGGVIGCEMAGFYASMKTSVVLIEMADRLLPTMDKELSQGLKMQLRRQGVEVLTSAVLEKVEAGLNLRVMVKGQPQLVQTEALLVATGRRPQSELGDAIGLKKERGRILVNDQFETSISGVYAIGDVSGKMQLAHAAMAQGVNAVMAMQKRPPVYDLSCIPACVYTSPEIAAVGMSLEEAQAAGFAAESVKITMGANGKSVLSGSARGMMKIIIDCKQHAVLGAVLMCDRATDMVSQWTQAIVLKTPLEALQRVIFPHPTYSEAIQELIEMALSRLAQ